MSNLNERDVAIMAVKRLKAPDTAILPIMTLVNSALNGLALDSVNDLQKRRWIMTDPASVTAPVVSETIGGVTRYYADLATLDLFLQLDYLNYGTITYQSAQVATVLMSGALVAGAGSSLLNGIYSARGTYNGKNYYNLTGQASDVVTFKYALYQGDDFWEMTDGSGALNYISDQTTTYPWQVTSWTVAAGANPAPSVSISPVSGSLYFPSGNSGLSVGDNVTVSSTGTLPSPLLVGTVYIVAAVSGAAISLLLNATSEGFINITTFGTGILTVTKVGTTILQWLQSPNQGSFTPSIPISYTYGWLVDERIYLSAGAGTLAFNCPFYPTLDTLHPSLETDLIDQIIDLYISSGNELPKAASER